MLIHSKLPMNFWGEALFTACYITNRILHKNQNKTPYEMWENRKPNIDYFKVWGVSLMFWMLHKKGLN